MTDVDVLLIVAVVCAVGVLVGMVREILNGTAGPGGDHG